MQADTIEQAIDIMDAMLDDFRQKNSRLGYFASLYRMVTVVVKERCDEGNFFEDNDRMRKLDVIFANRYFEALNAYLQGGNPTKSWGISFEMETKKDLLILQHLLLGMNAHIALDLGIAAAEVSGGVIEPSLERDFMRLNNLLGGLIDTVQDEIGVVSPLLKYLDFMGGRLDETFVSFSINYARDKAWEFAQLLTPLTPEQRVTAIIERDEEVSNFARRVIASTSMVVGAVVWVINRRESKDVGRIIQVLSQESDERIKQRVYHLLRKVEEEGLDLSSRDTQLFRVPNELREY